MAKSPPRPQRTCIFCGGKGLTREHAFAEWLRPYLRSAQPEHYFGDHELLPTGTTSAVKKWSGDPHSRRLRVVCKTCNEGWMSKLQQTAKPYLVPLVDGQNCVLGETAQNVLAAWGAMSVMVSEHFVRPAKRAISKEERQHLWLRGTPPETFKIWIGHYARHHWRGRWFYTSAALADNESDLAQSAADRMPIPNANDDVHRRAALFSRIEFPGPDPCRQDRARSAILRPHLSLPSGQQHRRVAAAESFGQSCLRCLARHLQRTRQDLPACRSLSAGRSSRNPSPSSGESYKPDHREFGLVSGIISCCSPVSETPAKSNSNRKRDGTSRYCASVYLAVGR